MKPSSSSKKPKKISDEDRSKKKNIKSKSTKRRRHRDSSISSYSSSDSEEMFRSRRKSSKSKKFAGKRKRESKKLDIKSLRKKKRARRNSSISDSSSGCSTCSESERSRSPIRKSKIRKSERVRGRKISRLYEASRSRNRDKSPSCSTCSGSSRSRSRSNSGIQFRSPIERFDSRRKRSAPVEGRVESIREQSPIEERFGSSRGWSPIDDRFESTGWKPVDDRFETMRGRSHIIERYESSRKRSPIESRFESSQGRSLIADRFETSRMRSPIDGRFGSSHGHGPIDEKFGSGHGQSPIDDRFGISHGQSPIDDRFESCNWQSPVVDRLENDGWSPVDGRFESNRERSPIDDRCWENGGAKKLRSVLVVRKSADEGGNIIKVYDGYPSSQSNQFYDEGNNERGLNVEDKEKDPYESQFRKDVILSGDRSEDEGKEADDLELILRQKALENFKKFRGIRPAKLESLGDSKDGNSKLVSFQDSQNVMTTSELESKRPKLIDDQRYVQGGDHLNKLKATSVPGTPSESANGNTVRLLSSAQNTPNRLKRVQESSNETSQGETSLVKGNPNGRVAPPGSGKVSGDKVGTTDMPIPGACNKEKQNCKSDEPTVDSASGSQYEQKTFSRMRDGEMVQVSYKVYIPKKTPTLAQRQLQR